MRSLPLVFGFVVGVAVAAFPGCVDRVPCSPTSCPNGCCDASGACQRASNGTCGTKGATCAVCANGETCAKGVCERDMTAPPADYGAFLTELAQRFCQRSIECLQSPPSSASTCASITREGFATFGLEPSVGVFNERSLSKGYATFDLAGAKRCLDAVSVSACPASTLDFTCLSLLHANTGPGGVCAGDADCVSANSFCGGLGCTRRCLAEGVVGGACGYFDRCAGTAFCDPNRTCRMTSLGAPCSSESECGPGMICDASRCANAPTAGQQCWKFVCAPDAYCDGQRICRTKKPLGESCTSPNECSAGLTCLAQACQPFVGLGGSCAAALCEPNLVCDRTQHCAGLAFDGGACTSNFDCAGGLTCDDVMQICQPPTPASTGAPCSSSRTCSQRGDVCRGKVISADGGASSGVCGPPPLGEHCSFHAACGVAQYCSGGPTPSCVAADGGTPCTFSSNCEDGRMCFQSVCTLKAGPGEPCDSTSPDPCAVLGQACLEPTPGVHRCLLPPSVGQPCVGGVCESFAVCLDGTCVAAGRLGQPCLEKGLASCIASACLFADGGVRHVNERGGTCRPPVAEGVPCFSNAGCVSGFCRWGFENKTNLFGICAAVCD